MIKKTYLLLWLLPLVGCVKTTNNNGTTTSDTVIEYSFTPTTTDLNYSVIYTNESGAPVSLTVQAGQPFNKTVSSSAAKGLKTVEFWIQYGDAIKSLTGRVSYKRSPSMNTSETITLTPSQPSYTFRDPVFK
ncbi:hypothetical protein HQ865_01365 [Mucilaginibacter mali]|uniref:Uncharacterized protein n=1 Tax=Mucilaginibacter mali TaxID=2740462 RepID=A0A7D4Q7X6_9SPHI|nr:hypothetical protein [Mucilaginibacter mali]QKJ28464.1 hypothetical protein HQ865_01365 [Mucilaginibacter mali]